MTRFIPAYAGNSFSSSEACNDSSGSSPLTRGTLLQPCHGDKPQSVHPRLRGELVQLIQLIPAHIGSSPLTRGTRILSRSRRMCQRFIPAYAGNSRIPRRSRCFCNRFIPAYAGNSHRGELRRDPLSGSSPLTRGTHSLQAVHPRNPSVHPRLRGELQGTKDASGMSWRFIPAYAGNSWHPNGRSRYRSVHPRLRGELSLMESLEAMSHGSSPLTRGTRSSPMWFSDSSRFIPAYAGNSV